MDVCLQFLIARHFVFACIFIHHILPERMRRVGVGFLRQDGHSTRAPLIRDSALLVALLVACQLVPSSRLAICAAQAQSIRICWIYCMPHGCKRLCYGAWAVVKVIVHAGAQVYYIAMHIFSR